MKYMVGIACVVLVAAIALAVDYDNAPEYQKGDFYVFTNAVTATNALNAVNGSGWFPLTGKNAKTGQEEPDKTKTVKWADEVQATADGKYVFPRIPTKLLDAKNVPVAERKAWWDAFLPEVEQYNPAWFPVEE